MTRCGVSAVALMLIAVFASPLTAIAEEDAVARGLIDRVYTNLFPADEITEMSMLLIHPNGQQKRWRVKQYYQREPKNGTGAVLLRFIEPPDLRGATLISVSQRNGGNNQWLYLPAFPTPQLLTAARKTDYVFGSDLTFEDFVPSEPGDFSYEIMREETFKDRPVTVIRRRPTAPKLVERVKYAYQVFWVDHERDVFLRVDYFDSIGGMYKTVTWSDFFQPEKNLWRARRATYFSPLRPHWTEVSVEEILVNRGLPADFFSERNLTSLR